MCSYKYSCMNCQTCSAGEDHDHYMCPSCPKDCAECEVGMAAGRCHCGAELEVRPCICDEGHCTCA